MADNKPMQTVAATFGEVSSRPWRDETDAEFLSRLAQRRRRPVSRGVTMPGTHRTPPDADGRPFGFVPRSVLVDMGMCTRYCPDGEECGGLNDFHDATCPTWVERGIPLPEEAAR